MTHRDELLSALGRVPVVGILRGAPPDHAVSVGTAAVDAGILVIEVTFDSPSPAESIARLVRAAKGAIVGAGTIRTPADVQRAAAAGAAFIVTPMLSLPVVRASIAAGLPCIPGAATTTEIWEAVEAGATAVKVFPARELGGPAYLRAIGGPLGHPPLVPTGGVGVADAAGYLDAGALAVGIGGSVFPRDALASGDTARVASLASDLLESLA